MRLPNRADGGGREGRLFENLVLGHELSEYPRGCRALSRKVLERLPLEEDSDDCRR